MSKLEEFLSTLSHDETKELCITLLLAAQIGLKSLEMTPEMSKQCFDFLFIANRSLDEVLEEIENGK